MSCCDNNHRVSACEKFKKMKPRERLDIIKEKRLCFNCLDYSNHLSRRCIRPNGCENKGCKLKHSQLLHDALMDDKDNNKPQEGSNEKPKVEGANYACGPSDDKVVTVALPIVPVYVRGNGQSDYILTNALLDSGSNKTFCSKSLLEQLNVKGKETTLSLETLGDGKVSDAIEVHLEVTATTGRKKKRKVVQLPKVYALNNFPALRNSKVPLSEMQKWNHFKNVNIPKVEESGVTIIIGQDVPVALIPLDVRHGNENEPYATRTVLGWTLNGPLHMATEESKTHCYFIQADPGPDLKLESQVEQFWKLDTCQVLAGSEPQMSQKSSTYLE